MLSLNGNGDLPIGAFGALPPGASKSNWGAEWKATSLKWHDRVAQLNMYGEHMSYRQNYIDLDPTYTDKFGDPVLRFTLDWTEHEHKQREFAYDLAAKIAPAMGAKMDPTRPSRAKYNVINYQSTHIQGGAVMGASPETSVVNPYLQHWDVPNLWVIGASSFPANCIGQSDAHGAGDHVLGGGRDDRQVSEESGEAGMKRREFLTIPASALGGTLLYTLAREPFRLQAQEGNVKVPLRFFSAGEARVIAAACERIFPSDASGPGAKEAGVVIYIDRQLAGPYGADKYRYTKGPFVESVPEHGYQGEGQSARDVSQGHRKARGRTLMSLRWTNRSRSCSRWRRRISSSCCGRTPSKACSRTRCTAGTSGLIGWQLVGYPGPRMSYKAGHRPALRHGMAAQTGRPGTDHAASRQALGRREELINCHLDSRHGEAPWDSAAACEAWGTDARHPSACGVNPRNKGERSAVGSPTKCSSDSRSLRI